MKPTLACLALASSLAACAVDDAPTTTAPALAAAGCSASDTLAAGKKLIKQGRYDEAVAVYGCVIAADPYTVDAYRGRSEARLMLGQFAAAYRDYALLVATMQVDVDDLAVEILASYASRLATASPDLPTLTGASFARWVFWEYRDALPLLDELLARDPGNVYAHLFRGSNRLFAGVEVAAAHADLAQAIALAPASPDVRFIVADAYTYAFPDPDRAFAEATLALAGGLDTPRVHAILASALLAGGDMTGAAQHLQRHVDLVTTTIVGAAPLDAGGELHLDLEPGVTFEIPVAAVAGQPIVVETSSPSPALWDTIMVLLGPDGTPVAGSDDAVGYLAALDWVAPVTGTYLARVTSFEGVTAGRLTVTRP